MEVTMKRRVKYLLVWALGVALILTVGRMLSYLIAALSGVGAAFSLTMPALLIVLHGSLLWAWFKRGKKR